MNYPSGNLHWSKKTKILQKHTTIFTISWLGKFQALLLLVAGAYLTACEAPKEIGLPPATSVGVTYTDTVTVRFSTMLLDSVRTSGALRLLAGNYQNPALGRVSARPYFSVVGAWSFDETKTYEYDSVSLSVGYSYVYGDTIQPFTLNIHRLTDSIQLNKTYYNSSSLAFAAAPLIKYEFLPRPVSAGTLLNIRLPDAFGKELFDAAKNKEFVTQTDILKRLKGFAFVPDNNRNLMLGFVPTSVLLRVFLHETGQTTVLVRDFTISARRFNQVTTDRRGTSLAQLQPLRPVSAAQTGGLAYLQDATGLVMKVEFPYLSKITNGPDKAAINRAELTLTPNQPLLPPNSVQPLPAGLVMAETDENNRVLRTKADLELFLPQDNSTFLGFVNPQVVPYDPQFRNYNFVMTTYLQALVTGFKKNKSFLLMPINSGDWFAATSRGGVPSRFNPYLNNGVTPMSIAPSTQTAKLQLFYTVIK